MDRARLLATHCALLVTATQSPDKAVDLFETLQGDRQIGIAVGTLMARRNLTQDQAFDVLRYATQNSDRTLQDVAAEVADTGADPDVESPVEPAGAAAAPRSGGRWWTGRRAGGQAGRRVSERPTTHRGPSAGSGEESLEEDLRLLFRGPAGQQGGGLDGEDEALGKSSSEDVAVIRDDSLRPPHRLGMPAHTP